MGRGRLLACCLLLAVLTGCASAEMVPQGKVAAQSPWNPPMYAPTSTLTMSPSCRTRGPGMPWMISSLTLMQALAG